MSRNLYDPSTDTLTPIAGYQPVDQALSDTSGNPVSNRAIKAALDNKASQTNLNSVANKVSNSNDVYSPSKAYKVGEYVIHDDVLYRCTTACSAAAWSVNQSCFTADTLTNVASLLNTHLSKFLISGGVRYIQFTGDSNTIRINFYVAGTAYYSAYVTTYAAGNNYLEVDYYNGSSWTIIFKTNSIV